MSLKNYGSDVINQGYFLQKQRQSLTVTDKYDIIEEADLKYQSLKKGKKYMNVQKSTDLDIRKMQEQVMSEDDRNHLFGTYGGSPIGLSLDNRVSHLNLNTLVLSGSGNKAWNNYVLPNIPTGNCSAVIMGKDVAEGLESKGIRVSRMDFESGHSEVRYNPFRTNHVPSIVPKEVAQLSRMVSLTRNVYKLFAEDIIASYEGGHPFSSEMHYGLIERVFAYVGTTPDLEDSERDFAAVKNALEDIKRNGKEALPRYITPIIKASEGYITESIAGCGVEEIRAGAGAVLKALCPFWECDAFSEDKDNPGANITEEDFVNELTYIFIPYNETESVAGRMATVFVNSFVSELYNYGDSDWKHPYQALENPVHFYLDGATFFPELAQYMATGGKYGISFSLMTDISTVKRLYGDDAKALFGNADTILLLEAEPSEAGLFKEIVPMPDQSEEDICELTKKDKAILKIRSYPPIICDILR